MAETERRLVSGLDLGKVKDYTAFAMIEATRPLPPKHAVEIVDRKDGMGPITAITPDWKPARANERDKLWTYRLMLMKRWDVGTPYTAICEQVAKYYSRPPERNGLGGTMLAVDKTGVGVAVVEMVAKEMKLGSEQPCAKCDGSGKNTIRPGDVIFCAFCQGTGKTKIAKAKCQLRPITITGGHQANPDGAGWKVPKRELVSVLQVLMGTKRLKVDPSMENCRVLVKEFEGFSVKQDKDTGHESFEAWRENVHDDMVLAVAIALWVAERASKQLWVA